MTKKSFVQGLYLGSVATPKKRIAFIKLDGVEEPIQAWFEKDDTRPDLNSSVMCQPSIDGKSYNMIVN